VASNIQVNFMLVPEKRDSLIKKAIEIGDALMLYALISGTVAWTWLLRKSFRPNSRSPIFSL